MKKRVYQQPHCEASTIVTENFIALSVPLGGGGTGQGGTGGGGEAKPFLFDNEDTQTTEEVSAHSSRHSVWD